MTDPLDHIAAEQLDHQLRSAAAVAADSLELVAALVEEAKAGRVHELLGFPSWTAYLADALGGKLHVPDAVRSELIGLLSDEGMSVRGISAVTRVSKSAVSRQVSHGGTREPQSESVHAPLPVVGLDGKVYRKRQPKPVSPNWSGDVGNVVVPLPTTTPTVKYTTFVVDPPWRYENTSSRGAAENHYGTMSIRELRDLHVVPDLADKNAHLYLWTTTSHLRDAFEVMESWGFTYKSDLVWVKPQMGMGNYVRVSHEHVLFGVKGRLPTLANNVVSHFSAPRRRHSQKPPVFLDIVERLSPGPRLEVFSRCLKTLGVGKECECARCLKGWDVWGNQAADREESA
ncbi:MT-A70 family methyltransferase [Mycobacteroides abscessus subsp. abscessus]|uniref:MT-A70 family methyltransferase n=1 Tax=Mycobacteroides abscessus TaxID=36809 RepID=UPI0039F03939